MNHAWDELFEKARKLADTIEEAPSIPRGATKQRHSKCTCRKSKPELETGNVLAVSRSSHSGVNKPIDYQRGLFLCAVSYSKEAEWFDSRTY